MPPTVRVRIRESSQPSRTPANSETLASTTTSPNSTAATYVAIVNRLLNHSAARNILPISATYAASTGTTTSLTHKPSGTSSSPRCHRKLMATSSFGRSFARTAHSLAGSTLLVVLACLTCPLIHSLFHSRACWRKND